MNNPSINHHYIPKFYLDGFTNLDGEFYIYNVKTRKFKQKGRPFTPKSHFFTEKGNTLEVHGVSYDFLETNTYAPLDNDLAVVFDKIKKSNGKNRYDLSEEDVLLLEYFFGHLYWRNPNIDEFLKTLLKTKKLSELGIKIKGEEKEKTEFLLKSDPDFYKILKSLLPGSLFHNFKKDLGYKYQILEYPAGLPKLMGDNPVLFKNKTHYNFNEDVLVPITSEIVFSRNKKEIKYIDTTVKTLIDFMLFKQSNEYVCVTDLYYIEQLEDTFSSIKDFENLRALTFHGLEKDHGITS